MMTGIELLQMIKNGEIKEGTGIIVLRANEECGCFDVVAKLKYSDNDLLWSPGTFRSSMLWDNDYLFEIVDNKDIPHKIENLYHIFNDNNKKQTYYKLADEMFYKINELIKAVNYLLDTQNKG